MRGFLGVDYPAMLAGEDTGTLGRIVLLRDEGGTAARGRRAAAPVVGLGDFLDAGDGVDPAVTAARAAGVQPGDVSDLIFTSGTTGHPKGAATTHAQTLRTFGTWSSIVGLAAGDRYLVVNPFFHTFGYKAGILACLMAGATVVPEPVFDAVGGDGAHRRRAHHGAARARPRCTRRCSPTPGATSTTCRRSVSGSPARRWCPSSSSRRCATSSASTRS